MSEEGLERETTTGNVLLLSHLLPIVGNLEVYKPDMNLGIPHNHTVGKSLPAFYHYDHEGTPHPRSQGQESGTGRIPPKQISLHTPHLEPLCYSVQRSIRIYFVPDIVLDSGNIELQADVPIVADGVSKDGHSSIFHVTCFAAM